MDIFEKLRKQSLFAYLLIGTLLAAIIVILWILISKQEQSAININTMGKQRMLSQRIALISQTVYFQNRSDLVAELKSSIREMRANHAFIQKIRHTGVQNFFYGKRYDYDRHVRNYLEKAEHFAHYRDRRSLDYLILLSDYMLNTADAMVHVYEQEYNRTIRSDQYILIVLTAMFLIFLYSVYRNITLRSLQDASAIHQELKLSEEMIRGLTHNTQSLISVKEPDGRYRFVNQSFARLLGRNPADIIGQTDYDLFDPETAQAMQQGVEEVLRRDDFTASTMTFYLNGRDYTFTSDLFLIHDSDHRPNGICSVATDITQQMRLNDQLLKVKAFLTKAQSIAKLCSWSVDRESRALHLSENGHSILPLDYEGEAPTLDELISQILPADRERIRRLFEKIFEYGSEFSAQFHILLRKRMRVLNIIAESLIQDGNVVKIQGTLQDITASALTQEKMAEYVEMIDENIIASSTDANGTITYASQAFSKVSGYSKEELVGHNHRMIRHPDMPQQLFTELWQTIRRGETWQGEIKNRTKEGGYYWVSATIRPNIDYRGEIVGYTAIRENITDKKQIQELSITDPLTGLHNRRHFTHIAQKEINRALRDGSFFAFVILDVDHFKKYNDTYGHTNGDQALIQVADALRESFQRAGDHLFRLGGEEFAILLSDKELATLVQSVERGRAAIEAAQLEHRHNPPSGVLTASFGMAVISPHSHGDKTIDTLYQYADKELYRAKSEGRNRLCSIDLP